MATYLKHAATSTSPAEYAIGQPIACNRCGTEWDEDDEADMFDLVDGDAYCTDTFGSESCFSIAVAAAYRRDVAEIVASKLREATDAIEALEERRQYKGREIDAHDHPAAILEDAQERVRLFGEGKDSGWRNGLMLDSTEARKLERTIEASIHSQSFDLLWELGVHPVQPDLRLCGASAGVRARELARTAVSLLDLQALLARTEKGDAA